MLNVNLYRLDKIMGTLCNSIKSIRSLKMFRPQREVIQFCSAHVSRKWSVLTASLNKTQTRPDICVKTFSLCQQSKIYTAASRWTRAARRESGSVVELLYTERHTAACVWSWEKVFWLTELALGPGQGPLPPGPLRRKTKERRKKGRRKRANS